MILKSFFDLHIKTLSNIICKRTMFTKSTSSSKNVSKAFVLERPRSRLGPCPGCPHHRAFIKKIEICRPVQWRPDSKPHEKNLVKISKCSRYCDISVFKIEKILYFKNIFSFRFLKRWKYYRKKISFRPREKIFWKIFYLFD